jgi:hypothetical protein
MPEEASNRMKKQLGLFAAVCFLVAGFAFTAPQIATAQDQGAVTQPPKILAINREFVKPTGFGSAHQQSETALAQAMAQANSPDHYSGWVALTGKLRVLFISGFDSYADYQKMAGNMGLGNNSAESQAYDRLQRADSKLLTQMDSAVFSYQPDMSLNAAVDIAHMRFLEITAIRIRPGQDDNWHKLAKLHDSIFGNMPGAHWAMFEGTFGSGSGLFLAISPMKSLADIDANMVAGKQAWVAASADQKQQIRQLEQAAFESIETNLYAADPNMSYVGDKWKNADPSFWKQ